MIILKNGLEITNVYIKMILEIQANYSKEVDFFEFYIAE